MMKLPRQPLGFQAKHFEMLKENISVLKSSDKFVDLIFQCADGSVSAHKTMLAPYSPFLSELFTLSFNMQSSDVTIISLAEFSKAPVKMLMTYIYTGEVQVLNNLEKSDMRSIAESLDIKTEVLFNDAFRSNKSKGKDDKQQRSTKAENIKVSSQSASKSEAKRTKRSLSPTTAPKRLGGLKRFDSGDIQEAIMENAKTRAETDKMKVSLVNVSKDQSIKQKQYLNALSLLDVKDTLPSPREPESKSKGKKRGVTFNISNHEDETTDTIEPCLETLDCNKNSNPSDSKKSSKTTKKNKQSDGKMTGEAESKKTIEDEVDYEVEKIVDQKEVDGAIMYYVKWKNWSNEDNTWEPLENLVGAEKAVENFKSRSTVDNIASNQKDEGKEKEEGKIRKGRKRNSNTKLYDLSLDKEDDKNQNLDVEYEVEEIVTHKEEEGGVISYFVKWKNWSSDDNTWEPKENLVGSETLVEKYHQNINDKVINKKDKKEAKIKNQSKSKKKSIENAKQSHQNDEYEVEKIVEKRDAEGKTEYLVKWKGWDNIEDMTWEPFENLQGSETLIKRFEKSFKKDTNANQQESRKENDVESDEDGVVLCESCNRIFVSNSALKKHEKEEHKKLHKKENGVKRKISNSPKENQKSIPSPKPKKPKFMPFFKDETDITDDLSPTGTAFKRDDMIEEKSSKPVDLSDSSDDETIIKMNENTNTFDDLFPETTKESINYASSFVFNKDSDDESDDARCNLDVNELLGESDDDK